ncbi:unnamed protein product, partial [Iphiclides podalirius]
MSPKQTLAVAGQISLSFAEPPRATEAGCAIISGSRQLAAPVRKMADGRSGVNQGITISRQFSRHAQPPRRHAISPPRLNGPDSRNNDTDRRADTSPITLQRERFL